MILCYVHLPPAPPAAPQHARKEYYNKIPHIPGTAVYYDDIELGSAAHTPEYLAIYYVRVCYINYALVYNSSSGQDTR